MAYDPSNIFAKILRGEADAHKVYEDDHAVAFMDLFPQSRGHTLVVPKFDSENIFDAPPEGLCELIARVQKVAAAVREALEPDGIQIFQFNGKAAGQSVFHLHFHIVPRYEKEPLKGHGQADQAGGDELKELAEQIAGKL
ncbi:MAG: HIT family protein [Alphaproteobacteria bacterium]